MSANLQTVHVRVNDAATRQPTPCRVRFTGADGTYYAPFGRLTEFAESLDRTEGGNIKLRDRCYAYIDGVCEIRLPPGPISVEVSKGPEYFPLREQFVLSPGQLSIRLSLERWIDMRQDGWYSGTCAMGPTPHVALLEAAAEDVAVVNLLAASRWEHGDDNRLHPSFRHLLAFSGQVPALTRPGHMVVVNTMNCSQVLGCLALSHCHRIVYPLTFGGPEVFNGPRGFDNWTLADWADQCHRKGGLVISGMNRFTESEQLADLILGKIDAIEIMDFESPRQNSPFNHLLRDWYGLLDCRFRVPVVGRNTKVSTRDVIGALRTYAQLSPGMELFYRGWIDAVRAGQTFVTNGPLVRMEVNGKGPGAVIESADGDRIHIRAQAQSLVAFDRLWVIANGQIVAQAEASGSPASARIDVECPLPQGGWIAASCTGCWNDDLAQNVGAQTSPVYVTVGGKGPDCDLHVVDGFVTELEKMLAWVHTEGRFENDQQRDRLAGIFLAAKEELARRTNR